MVSSAFLGGVRMLNTAWGLGTNEDMSEAGDVDEIPDEE